MGLRRKTDPAPRGWHPSVTREEIYNTHQSALELYLESLNAALLMRDWGLVEDIRRNMQMDFDLGEKTYEQVIAEMDDAR